MMIEIINEKKDIDNYFEVLKKRGNVNSGDFSNVVKEIISDIRENKDQALEKYTKKFDDKNFSIKDIEVSKEEQEKAFLNLDEKLKNALLRSKERIYSYHSHQKEKHGNILTLLVQS